MSFLTKVIQSAPSEFLVTFKTLKLYNLKKIKMGGLTQAKFVFSRNLYSFYFANTFLICFSEFMVLAALSSQRNLPPFRPTTLRVPCLGGTVSLDWCLDLLYSPSHPVPTKTGAHQTFESEYNPGGLIFWWALGGNDLGALKVIKRTRAPVCRNALRLYLWLWNRWWDRVWNYKPNIFMLPHCLPQKAQEAQAQKIYPASWASCGYVVRSVPQAFRKGLGAKPNVHRK